MSVQRQERPVREVSIEAMRDERLSHAPGPGRRRGAARDPRGEAATRGPARRCRSPCARPGHDIELAAGFLHGEGIMRRARGHRRQPHLRPGRQRRARSSSPGAPRFDAGRLQRNFYTTSSCGVCGKASLDARRAHAALAAWRHPDRVGRADRRCSERAARGAGRVRARPAACMRPACSMRDGGCSTCARTSAGTTRSTSWSARALLGGRAAAVAARAVPVRPRELRAAAEGRGRGHPGGRRGRRALLASPSTLAQRTGILLVGFLRGPLQRLCAPGAPAMSAAAAPAERARRAPHPRDRRAAPHRDGPLIEVLHAVQAALGCIPPGACPVIARALNLSRAEVHGVVSFYHYFRDDAAGRHVVQICRAEACQAMDGERSTRTPKQRLGIDFHQTTRGRRVHARAGLLPRQLRLLAGGDDRRRAPRPRHAGALRRADRREWAGERRDASTVYVPRDAGALVARRGGGGARHRALKRAGAASRSQSCRNGSRGLFWLEPLVEVETPAGASPTAR